jgi:mRNA interferase RelE/StbE
VASKDKKGRPQIAPSATGSQGAATDSQGAEVWLTEPAVDDLRRLDGAALVWALKKMLVLERDPNAGAPLLGKLINYRKIVVGDRDWRIVWRTTTDARGHVTVDIAEVWAVGARSDDEVYAEVAARARSLGQSPVRTSLERVIADLGKAVKGVTAKPVAQARSAPEPWLVDRLVHTVGLTRADVEQMTSEEAVDAWTAYMISGGASS